MMKSRIFGLAILLLSVLPARGQLLSDTGTPAILSGVFEDGAFQPLTFVNSVGGWNTFFNAGYLGSGRIIANVEAGLVWGEHDWFLRPDGSPAFVGKTLVGTGALGELDYHATMVGHVLAGTGYVAGSDPEQFYYYGLGMAPMAEIWSGAIATSFSTTQTGSFETTTESTVSVYRAFFQGIPDVSLNIVKPDVINSSWGGADLQSPEMVAIEGLARQNPTVAFVAAAGNDGSNPVVAPASTFNSITVGSLGGASFLQPSAFSSHGQADFYNPVTGVTLEGVRAAVDIAAPGENLILAAYLGPTGSLGAANDPNVQGDPSPTDWFFYNESGTSFAAPLVSGGIALLKDVAANYYFFDPLGLAIANDTRVIKSVLMAGAMETEGWDNGQSVNGDGAILTTQALDYTTGAGALDLDRAVGIYLLSDTRDVSGDVGGAISATGWDFGTVGRLQSNDYLFSNPFETPVELTVSLNWFSGSSFNDGTGLGENLSFTDLNLQVWQVVEGTLVMLVAESSSLYNNAEFLRVDLPAGSYALRITFNGLVYETVPESVTGEEYGLAWHAVPEPGTLLLLVFAGAVIVFGLRNRRTNR